VTFPLRQGRLFGQLVRRRGGEQIYWCEPDMGATHALRRLVTDMETFRALFRADAVRVCDSLDSLQEGRPILPGSGLGNLEGTPQIYFLDSGYARLIENWLVFERCNFDPGKVKPMSRSVFDAHPGSAPISEAFRQPARRYPTVDIDDGEWKTFVDALKDFKRSGRYDPFIQVHSDHLEAIHSLTGRNVNFLPWHRVFLLELNRLIQDPHRQPDGGLPVFLVLDDRCAASRPPG
jgi:hypothetical protein